MWKNYLQSRIFRTLVLSVCPQKVYERQRKREREKKKVAQRSRNFSLPAQGSFFLKINLRPNSKRQERKNRRKIYFDPSHTHYFPLSTKKVKNCNGFFVTQIQFQPCIITLVRIISSKGSKGGENRMYECIIFALCVGRVSPKIDFFQSYFLVSGAS